LFFQHGGEFYLIKRLPGILPYFADTGVSSELKEKSDMKLDICSKTIIGKIKQFHVIYHHTAPMASLRGGGKVWHFNFFYFHGCNNNKFKGDDQQIRAHNPTLSALLT